VNTVATKEYSRLFLEGLKEADVRIATALPESLLKAIYRDLEDDAEIRYIPVASELEMPSIAVGAYLGGQRAVMVMENSGIRQACEPIARLARVNLPMVMVMPFRGDLGEPNWWGHTHAQTMVPLLDALRIPYRYVRKLEEIKPKIAKAFIHADSSQWPFALIFADECVEGRSHATN
jgi:sulfopyruvate decarboxylase subunit alpha